MTETHLKHKLGNRHLQMIAMGGVIGTGLFFGLAKSIHATGPSILLAYLLGGIIIYIIMRALGEMTVDNPTPGSFSQYAHTHIGTYAGFIAGWSAWFEYVVVCMAELTAVTVFFDYFVPGIPHWILCSIILLLFVGINLVSVRLFGEFEFWFAGIKIVAIVLMLVFSAYLITCKHAINPELNQYMNLSLFFAGGIKGFAISLVFVMFSFGGSEFVSIAAGEAANPRKNVPLAINGIIVRILLFYIFTILAIILLYPYQKLSTHISPFVDVFRLIGFPAAAATMNVVAITAALSSFNSCLYSASRMLFNLSSNGFAPQHFASTSKVTNVPRKAILASAIAVAVTVLVNYLFPDKAIMYLLTVTTSAILIVWFIILLTQIYFRKHKNATHSIIHYKLGLFPYTTVFAMVVLVLVLGIMTQISGMRISVLVTPLWILGLSIVYLLSKKLHTK